MYDIYIKYYADSSGNLITTETKLYSVPITNPDNALKDPVVKCEMGKTGSFEFSMTPVHPYYNSMLQMKTMMRVVYDGTTIFRGRVLTIDTTPFTGERKIHLEGDLAFLMDSVQKGVDEDDRSELSVLDYLKDVLKQHNDQMIDSDTVVVGKNGNLISLAEAALAGSTGASGGIDLVPGTSQLDVQESAHVIGDISLADKKIVIGEVPGNYSSSISSAQKVNVSGKKKFGNSSWEQSASAIESLAKDYGGYFRTRYEGSTCYLDWLDNSFQYTVNAQPIELTENMIDINGSAEVDNIFTALIPIGSNDGDDLFINGYKNDIHGNNSRILVPQIAKVYSDSQLNHGYHAKSDYLNAVKDYGLIYRTQSFPNADTQEKLWSYAVDWIKENYVGGLTSFDITAIDMHHVDNSVPKYLVGDRVKVIYPDMVRHTDGNTPMITKTLTIMSIQYNLHSPEQNQYSIGVPNLLLSHEYGSSANSSSSSSSGSGGGKGGGGGGYTPPPGGETTEERIRRLEGTAKKYVANARYNGDVYDEIYASKVKEYGDTPEGREKAKKVSGQVLQTTIHVVTTGLNAADSSSPTTSRSKKTIRSMFIDGSTGQTTINSPVATNPWQLSDEQIDALNRTNKAITFDALKKEFGIWNATTTVFGTPEEIMKKAPGKLLSMKLGINPTNNKAQGSLTIGNENTPVDGSKFPGFSAGGDGVTKQTQSLFGKGDGTDPETSPTADINGKNGSAGFGENGDLGGSKITINRPLTYKWTDGEGKQHTGTLKAGTIGLSDVHFTKTYDSLKVELGYFESMYADYAKIGTLEAMKAVIDDLDVTIARIADAKIQTLTAGTITAAGFSTNGNISGSSITGDGVYLRKGGSLANAIGSFRAPTYSGDNVQIQTVKIDGTNGPLITFKKGDTEAAYNQGWNECIGAATRAYGSSVDHFSATTVPGVGTVYSNIGNGWVKGEVYTLPKPKS